jgi:hypothetical protein
MIKNIYEILDEFEQATNKEQRIKVLQDNAIPHFLQVLKYTFDPQYQFYIKEFPKNYIQPDTHPGIRYAGIESEIRRAYLFLKGNETADVISETKRNQILVELLEAFEPREAQVFVNMMKKNLQIKHLTHNLVKEAFPNLLQ